MLVRPDNFPYLLERLKDAPYWAFDSETTGLSPYTGDRIIGLSFAVPQHGGVHTFYVPFRHVRGHRLNLDRKYLRELAPIFQDETKTIVGWHSKFDLHFLHVDGIEVKCRVLDAMLAWHLVDENRMSFSLKDIAKQVLGKGEVQDDLDLQTLLKGEKLNKGDMKMLSPIEAAPYAESDASLTWRLFRLVVPKLQEEGLSELFQEECEYARVIERMERRGIKIDRVRCDEEIENAEKRNGQLLASLRSLAGDSFNPSSAPQCSQWLGLRSTARGVLEQLEPGREDVALLLEYRGHSKAVSAFYKPLTERRDRFNRVHASFKLHGTVSGRLSCVEPNLQQFPRNSARWHAARGMVIAGSGSQLLAVDLSQAELRLLAHYTCDPFLLRAYREDLDIHQMVADYIGIERQAAKTVNFAIAYGAGWEGIQKALWIQARIKEPEDRCKEIVRYHDRLIPNRKKLYYHLADKAERDGYIELWSGRRRHFPRGQAAWRTGEDKGPRTAMNNVIQGGVAEVMRVAAMQLDTSLPPGADMLVQVHDELLLQVKNKLVPSVAAQVKQTMEDVYEFAVPMVAEAKAGKSWGSMKELKL